MDQVVFLILSLLVLLFIGVVFLYFYMRGLRSSVMDSWVNVMEHLNVRLDKIPNLIETLRRLHQDRQELFQSMIELRGRAWQLDQPDRERVHAEMEVVGKLHECWKVGEQHEDVRKDTNFLELRTEFRETADAIDARTTAYNTKARHYNAQREFPLFKPLVLLLGFKRLPILEFE